VSGRRENEVQTFNCDTSVILLCFLLVGCGEEQAEKLEKETDTNQVRKETEEDSKDEHP